MRGILGVVLSAGLLVGCGSGEVDVDDAETFAQQEQGAEPCAPGYTGFVTLDCQNGCDVRYRQCCSNTNPEDCYDAGIIDIRCRGGCS